MVSYKPTAFPFVQSYPISFASRLGRLEAVFSKSSAPYLQQLKRNLLAEAVRCLVRSVAFSYNSKILISASRDNTIHLWDVATGACTAKLEAGRIVRHITFDTIDCSPHTDVGTFTLNKPPLSPTALTATPALVSMAEVEFQKFLLAHRSRHLNVGIVRCVRLKNEFVRI
jgi:WD40 repeat protein